MKTLLCNYLWSRSENTTNTHVSRDDCTMPKKVEGLSFILLDDAMKSLMSKWIIQALFLGK